MICPKVSILTICYNAVDSIKETIVSVINQTYANVEYIVIDGGSKDGTLDVIAEYNSKISKIVSEHDNGIYDAMNKGIEYVTGDWCIFMNAGDVFFENDVLEKVFNQDNSFYDLVYGDAVYRYTKKSIARYVKAKPLNKIVWHMVFSHQSLFVKSKILKERNFDTKYKFAADYDMILRCYLEGRKFCYLSIPISTVTVDDGQTANNSRASDKEVREIKICADLGVIKSYYDYYIDSLWKFLKGFIINVLPNKIIIKL